MAQHTFRNRREAGRILAARLGDLHGPELGLVLALPRGGVPVAFEVAKALGLPLDVMLVRKLGLPGQEELAMGAIASGGALVYNEELLRQIPVPQEAIDEVRERETRELDRREQLYRGGRAAVDVTGRGVILIDDGVATGATIRAAILALRQLRPAHVLVAVPVAPPATVAALSDEADEVVCLATPEPFIGVGRWYQDFAQTSDDEVRALLDANRSQIREGLAGDDHA